MNFTHIEKKIASLNACDVKTFDNISNSYRKFILNLRVDKFRHIKGLNLSFDHPVTLISGSNRMGKTSLLLLLACSHEKFMRLDASRPEPTLREHIWKDVMAFTSHESETNDYVYKMRWRTGKKINTGEGKRLASSRAWSGLAKKATDRTNAKIRDREVRLIDLDRLLPARSFSSSLLRKAAKSTGIDLSDNVVSAFCYVLDIPHTPRFSIKEVSGHVNKRCYVIDNGDGLYSSYNAATGEEALINLLRDITDCPNDSLVLIDELEAGFHPSVQRKLARVLCQIAWEQKKQFVITTHSATLIDAFPAKSRKFIEASNGVYRVISQISPQAALSKMDAIGHPLLHLYCEDDLAAYLIKKVMLEIARIHPQFDRLIDIVKSGPASNVKADFLSHKRKYSQVRNRIGYAAILDGDMRSEGEFAKFADENESVHFLLPSDPPEKFLAAAYLKENPNDALKVFLESDNHHAVFQKMVDLGMATDRSDARDMSFRSFKETAEYEDFFNDLRDFLIKVTTLFSDPSIRLELG